MTRAIRKPISSMEIAIRRLIQIERRFTGYSYLQYIILCTYVYGFILRSTAFE